MRRSPGSFVAVALAAIFASALPQATTAADPIDIPTLVATTGGLSFIGKAEADALHAFEAAANKSGGIDGRPVHFSIVDTQTNPAIALQLFDGIAAKKPAVVLGPESAAECNAVFAIAKSGPVVWCFSSAVNAQPAEFAFQTSARNQDYNEAGVRWIRKRGFTRVALITPTDATGQTYEKSIQQILAQPENHELTLVANEHFSPSDVSVVAQITRIRAANPQAIIVGTAGSPAGVVFHGLSDVGFDVPVVTGNGNASQAFMKQYATFLPRQLYVEATHCLAPAAIADRTERAAYDAYVAAMNAQGTLVDCLQTLGWDPAVILTTALRRLGPGASAQQLRDYLATARIVGVNGTYDFKRVPGRGIDDRDVVIVRWDGAAGTWAPASRAGGDPL
jgi:branched-chain amino acid transport system substrate-binding protein